MNSRFDARSKSARSIRLCEILMLLVAGCFLIPASTLAQNDTDESVALAIAQTAQTAQRAEEYELAARQWKKLLTQHPNSSFVAKAHFNAGVCFFRLVDFPNASTELKSAIEKLDKEQVQLLAQSHLYLGFCQLRMGQNMMAGSAADQPNTEAAKKSFTEATKSLNRVVEEFKDFPDVDQACFYLGESYEQLGDLDKALEAYKQMTSYEKQTFELDGLFAQAHVQEQQGNLESAIDAYDQFFDRAEAAGGTSLMTEVMYRSAATRISLAKQQLNDGKTEQAKTNFADAESTLKKVSKDKDFDRVDLALFQQAVCAWQLGELDRAGKLYDQVSKMENSELAVRSAVLAGRAFLQTENTDLAEASLKRAAAMDSPLAADATHSLSQMYLGAGKNQQAFEVANRWLEKSDGSTLPVVAQLMMDRADAAYQLKDRREKSPALYLKIFERYPKHELADSALYNAAYAFLDQDQLDDAIKTSDQFLENFETSSYLPDTLEVKADALLLKDKAADAETIFRRLVKDFSDNEKSPTWNLRVGLTSSLQGKHQDTIDWLAERAPKLTDAGLKAEAFHLLGSSHYRLKQNEKAIDALTQSVDAGTWRRADETLLTLARAQFAAGLADEGKQTSTKLVEQFPNSNLVVQAYYRLGEYAYGKNDFGTARENYGQVISNFEQSEFVPAARYGTAWSYLKEEKLAEAKKAFTELIDGHGEHELALRALVGRGACLRQSGDAKGAIADITSFLEKSKDTKAINDARYELGLAQVDQKQWPAVVETFKTLLNEDAESVLGDRYRYELAWAYQSQDDKENAINQFQQLAKLYPKSSLAPEASFHVAGNHYDNSKYDLAIANYQTCVESKASTILREKASYKLAWSHYKKQEFEKAHRGFAKQVADFPEGNLTADGMFMVAESLYRQKSYEPAYRAYRKAQPMVAKNTSIEPRIRWLTMLHGAQCANEIKNYQEALDMVSPLGESEADKSFKQDALLETGNAHYGLKQNEKAIEAWRSAMNGNLGKTGVRAQCMIGDAFFAQKKFDQAIEEYKLVMYGPSNTEEVNRLKAYAAYEAGTCNFVQIKDADPQLQPKLIAEAEKHYRFLIKQFPDDELVAATEKQLKTIEKLKSK